MIRRCRFEVRGTGITAINGGYEESRGFVITDNVFQGPTSWPRRAGIEDVNGIIVTGAGHVVAYNRLSRLGDGIHGVQYGRLSASDIYNNDVEVSTDDGIEADYGDTNVRVFRNRITNAFSGISAQPSNGGPLYVFRNAIYNVIYSPFKLHNDTAGVFIFHNTAVKAGIPFHIDPAGETVSDVITRNNLFIGTTGPALLSTGRMIRCGFDSDGYGGPGGAARAPVPARRLCPVEQPAVRLAGGGQEVRPALLAAGGHPVALPGELRERPGASRQLGDAVSRRPGRPASRSRIARRERGRRPAELQRRLRGAGARPGLLRAGAAAAALRPASLTPSLSAGLIPGAIP